MKRDKLYDIALTLCERLGPKTIIALLEMYGNAEVVYSKSYEELVQGGVGALIARQVAGRETVERAAEIVNLCEEKGVEVLVRGVSQHYPVLLAEAPDAPHVLYKYGDADLNEQRCVSIVGTRRASEQGIANTQSVVSSLATSYSDICIISGLALGIDKEAHRWALNCGVPTVAVLPGWVFDITPTSHRELAREIIRAKGAIVSDMPPGTIISRNNFLSRNRIIAAMSPATIVIESPERGGSISTATMALSYNRAVFALPGRSGDVNSYGTNLLIKTNRAIMYQDCGDLAVELKWERERCGTESLDAVGTLAEELKEVLGYMPRSEPITLEEVVELCGQPIGQVISMLVDLESRGYIKSIPSGMYIRAIY